ncbi:hypothetical protein SG34_032625 [Thalassomonas viridans]|uniref:Uncharacterized protein n=1 Tax=Thalassomonas viridans TaxID=137584 RepID=A0AAE9ZCM0_9GAMM|nr:hypothetical protein [Thalassomonas viridans]WDE08663.1 hypothetical protein SG34_032625 [Thalassomonas viridans]
MKKYVKHLVVCLFPSSRQAVSLVVVCLPDQANVTNIGVANLKAVHFSDTDSIRSKASVFDWPDFLLLAHLQDQAFKRKFYEFGNKAVAVYSVQLAS